MKIVKRNKVISVMILIIILISSFQNVAFGVEINQATILEGNDCGLNLQFNSGSGWSFVTTTYTYYMYKGNEYPAYCLDRKLDGVGELPSYTVSIEDTLDDDRIWRALMLGYPYKTPEQMGVETKEDAYVATKQAIYSILADRDIETFYRGGTERGNKIYQALKQMVYEGKNGTTTPKTASIQANKVGNLIKDGNYYTQTFSIPSNLNISNYIIDSIRNMPTGGYIADERNNVRNIFSGNESFKIIIPSESFTENIDISGLIKAKSETFPIFYGKAPNINWQNYALAFDPYGDSISDFNM